MAGVDWKSLTATACLPVTTDFFPDRLSLECDFVEFNYELLAEEDITGPFMTVDAIFQELISQRLLQGFQLVVLPSSVIASISRSQRRPPLVTNPERNEFVLSIGRIFHKICLHSEKKTISVTMYRPRHPSLCDPIQYTYQLWSVQNEGYTQIQTTFRHEVIERYNWNYLDNYISSHDSDFTLVDSLKFWRSRFMLIPNTVALTKRFAEEMGISTAEAVLCEREAAFRRFQIEAFLRFVEILNGIRRQTSTTRGPKAAPSSGRQTPIQGDLSHTAGNRSSPGPGGSERQRHSSGTGSPAPHPPNTTSSATAAAGALSSGEEPLSLCTPLPTVAKAMADTSKGLRFIPSGQKGVPPNAFMSGEAMTWVQKSFSGEVSDLEAYELLKNMQESRLIQHASGSPRIPFIHGFYVYCLALPENVPPMTDATKTSHSWRDFIPRIEGNPDFLSHWFEVAVMEELSWRQKAEEVVGCGPRSGSTKSSLSQEGFVPISPWGMRELAAASSQGFGAGSGSAIAGSRDFKPPETRNVMLEIDCNKTDRVEWCHVTYDGNYSVDRAFDMQVEWLVCTPSLLNEMLQGWSRKAITYGFHLVPAPTDPFHQHPEFANPLRCPLFIPLNIQALTEGEENQDYLRDEKGLQPGDKSIDMFQDLIMRQLGFILIRDKNRGAFDGYGFHSGRKSHQMEYIHKSGVSFTTLINAVDDPSIAAASHLPTSKSQCEVVKAPQRRKSSPGIPIMVGRDGQFDIVDAANDVDGSESEAPIVEERRKLRSGSIREMQEGQSMSVGFLWSMNHMLTKKWRCSACGDEKVYDSVMRELIDLSQNVGGKLKECWMQNKDGLRV